MTLTIIGNGEMAKALIHGLVKNYKLEVIGRDIQKLKELNSLFSNSLNIKIYEKNFSIHGKSLILCVKPDALKEVSKNFTGKAKLVLSILSGISIETLTNTIPSESYIKAMPNIAAAYARSITTFTGDKEAKEVATNILNSIGISIWLESEKELNISVPLAGCAPAFLAIVAQSLIDASVAQGLKRQDASKIAIGLFDGFSTLLKNHSPNEITQKVMSPGGSTAAGIFELESSNLRASFWRAIDSSYKKTI